MKARHAARELALLALFQLEKQGVDSVDAGRQAISRKAMEDLILDAVRALVAQASDQIQNTAEDLAALSRYVLEAEMNHPENLESPIDEPLKPVPIPTTREMIEKIELMLQGAENLSEAIRIPELAALSNAPEVRDYAVRLVDLVLSHRDELDAWIETYSEDWKVSRLVKIDRDILRLAAAEMKYVDNVDVGVSIDEAVELAKQFSTEESFRFINGVLGRMSKELDPSLA